MSESSVPTVEALQEKLLALKEAVIQSTRMSYCGYIWHPQWVVELFPDEGLRSSSGTYRKPAAEMASVGKDMPKRPGFPGSSEER